MSVYYGTQSGAPEHHYALHGLTLACPLRVPGCSPASVPGAETVQVRYSRETRLESLPSSAFPGWAQLSLSSAYDPRHDRGVVVSSRADHVGVWHLLSFRHAVPAEFLIYPGLDRIDIRWGRFPAESAPDSLPQDLASLLLGPVWGVLIRLRGRLSLHAGAVSMAGRALLFAGPSGAGKSTLLAAFAAGGTPVLADDQVVPSSGTASMTIDSGQTQPRLHPETLAHFGLAAAAPVFSIGDKRYAELAHVPLDAAVDGGVPVAALILLAPRNSPDTEIGLDLLSPVHCLNLLWENLYPAFLPVRSGERAGLFMALGELARRVPCYRLRRPDNLARLPEVCAALSRLIR